MSIGLRRLGGSLLLASVLELLLYFPVTLACYAIAPPGPISLAVDLLLLLAFYWIGYGINVRLKFKHPFPKVIISLLIAGVGGFLLFGISGGSVAMILLGTTAVYRGGRLTGMPLSVRLLPQDYIVGVVFYFAGAIMDSFNHAYDGYKPLYLAAGIVTLFAALFLTNRNMVGRETLSGAERPAVEPSVRRNNRIFVGVAMGITVLIALAFQLQKLLSEAWHAIGSWLMGLFKYHGKHRDIPDQTAQQQPFTPQFDKSGSHPAWLDYIMYVLAAIIVLVLLYFIARRLLLLPGWLKGLPKRFLQLFQRDRSQAARGYVDEIERIKKSENPFRRLFSRSKEERLKWKDLNDNESRLRYLYRRWIGNAVKKGFAHQPHLTPREIRRKLDDERVGQVPLDVSEALIEHYQQVRYGGGTLSDEQLQALAAKLGQAKP